MLGFFLLLDSIPAFSVESLHFFDGFVDGSSSDLVASLFLRMDDFIFHFISFCVRFTLPFFFHYFLLQKFLGNHEGVVLRNLVIFFPTGLAATCLLPEPRSPQDRYGSAFPWMNQGPANSCFLC